MTGSGGAVGATGEAAGEAAGEGVEERGLAGAGGPHDGEDLAGARITVEAAQDGDAAGLARASRLTGVAAGDGRAQAGCNGPEARR